MFIIINNITYLLLFKLFKFNHIIFIGIITKEICYILFQFIMLSYDDLMSCSINLKKKHLNHVLMNVAYVLEGNVIFACCLL